MPQMRDKTKLYHARLPVMAIINGTSPIHAKKPKSKFGNESTSRVAERKVRRNPINYRSPIEQITIRPLLYYRYSTQMRGLNL